MHTCAVRQEGNYTLTQSSDSHSWSPADKKHTGTVPSRTQVVSHTQYCPKKTMIKHCVWDGWQVCFLCDNDEERESLDCVKVYFPSWRAAQECIPPLLFKQCFVLKISQQAVVQTLLGKGLFLSVAHSVLPFAVSWKPTHLPIVFN